MERELNQKAIINLQSMQPGDVKESFADIVYSSEKLDYYPTTDIIDGIPLFISWYKKYYTK